MGSSFCAHVELLEQDVLCQIAGGAQFSGSDSYNSTSFNLTQLRRPLLPSFYFILQNALCQPTFFFGKISQ